MRASLTVAVVALSAGLGLGCGSTEVPLATEAPKADVPPPPAGLANKKAAPDGKDVRPQGGSGGIDISTYGK